MTSPRAESPTATSKFPPTTPSHRVLLIFGTRPEAIKLCPLVEALRTNAPQLQTQVCVTGQHREMLDGVLQVFGVQPDFDLNAMAPGQTLPSLTACLLSGLETVVRDASPSLIVVQGDTTTTLCGALSGFYARVPVAHVEAGLRTGDLQSPFPEEWNRVATSRLAQLHFAPTQWAADNLLREGIPAGSIEITGNTGIDAVLKVRDGLQSGALPGFSTPLDPDCAIITVTAHRRESFGTPLADICRAIASISTRDDVQIVWPVHPNPNVRSTIDTHLRGIPNIHLIDPLSYVPFIDLLRRSAVILTDSGGIQEEAPALGKPVLVLRENTERPEAVNAGTAKLVGTNCDAIVRECADLLDNRALCEAMARIHNPYGNGKASERIARRLGTFLGLSDVR